MVYKIFSLAVCLALSGCFKSGPGMIKVAVNGTIAGSQMNCALPNKEAVAAISVRLAASGAVIGSELCTRPASYECYVRKFSPSLPDNKSTIEECTHVTELGGNFCINLKSQVFNTREASRLPDTSALAVQPGGEFNRSEYVCHQTELREAESYLAVGESESLADALTAAHHQCSGIAPRLVSGK